MVSIAVAGKGGVGKTLITAGLAWTFARSGFRTIAIDADPSPNLALMLGLAVKDAEAIQPIAGNERLIRAKTTTPYPGVFNLNFTVDDIIRDLSVPTPSGAHILVMGTVSTLGEGCSCPANMLVRTILRHLVMKREEVIVMDMEAGVEHLGRGTAGNVDLMLVVTTADSRALITAVSIAHMARDAGIPFVLLAGNRIENETQRKCILKSAHKDKIPVLGFVPFDPAVAGNGIAGGSILQLERSDALAAIERITADILSIIEGKETKMETGQADLP